MTREVLLATVTLARRRGATPLVVVPQFGPEDDGARALRERIFTNDIPAVRVSLVRHWRLAWDRHPNSHAAHVIAATVATQLGPRARQAAIRIPRHAG